MFVCVARSDFMAYIQELRQRRGKLTGMTMVQIVQQVADKVIQTQKANKPKTPVGGAVASTMQRAHFIA